MTRIHHLWKVSEFFGRLSSPLAIKLRDIIFTMTPSAVKTVIFDYSIEQALKRRERVPAKSRF